MLTTLLYVLLKMKFTYTLAVLIAFFAAVHAEPDNDFCNDKDNGYYADPKNCIYYYHCFNHAVEVRLMCPNGELTNEC